MIEKIIFLMKKKKEENQFKSYTLNIVYDSICEVIKICPKLYKDITDCLREAIIKELAKIMRVSEAAMLYRLKNLGWLK